MTPRGKGNKAQGVCPTGVLVNRGEIGAEFQSCERRRGKKKAPPRAVAQREKKLLPEREKG